MIIFEFWFIVFACFFIAAGIFATWILTWPFSLFWELARKPAKYFYNVVYALLGDAFDRVGKRATKRILKK